MSVAADFAQTFFIDPGLVQNSTVAFVTSIQLFLSTKPERGNTSSNLPAPGITAFITGTSLVSGESVPTTSVSLGRSRVEYDSINVADDAQTPTTFTFNVPVAIRTGVMYAVVVKCDGSDTGFTFWRNKSSQLVNNGDDVATSTNIGVLDGKFFTLTNGSIPTPLHDTDLKIRIKVAKFSATTKTYRAVNRNYEFFRYNTGALTGNFLPGELVFANIAHPVSQTVSVDAGSFTVTGTGTVFQTTHPVGSYIILNSGTVSDVKRVVAVANNTSVTIDSLPRFTNATANYTLAPIGRVFDYRPEANSIVLVASTANSTTYFDTSQVVRGITSNATLTITSINDFTVHALNQMFAGGVPPATSVDVSVKLANSSYFTNNTSYELKPGNKTFINDFTPYIFSRSNEVRNSTYINNGKSANFNITLNTDNPYASPIVNEQGLNLFTYKFNINNSIANEHTADGNAIAKYISKTIVLAEGQDSEDMRVYVTAFKPQNTDIAVYVKLLNSNDPESMYTKDWSYLESITPSTLISNASNPNDFIELEYVLPNFPIANSETLSSGTLYASKFSSSNNSAVLVSAGTDVNTHIVADDVVRIYSPATPNNSLIAVVTASNTTTITIDTTLNSDINLHSGFIVGTTSLNVEKVLYKNSAFKNYLNQGVVRYISNSLGAYDTYKSFAFKIVLLSSDPRYRPVVENIRGIALSA